MDWFSAYDSGMATSERVPVGSPESFRKGGLVIFVRVAPLRSSWSERFPTCVSGVVGFTVDVAGTEVRHRIL